MFDDRTTMLINIVIFNSLKTQCTVRFTENNITDDLKFVRY